MDNSRFYFKLNLMLWLLRNIGSAFHIAVALHPSVKPPLRHHPAVMFSAGPICPEFLTRIINEANTAFAGTQALI